jgi:hypothetical protein
MNRRKAAALISLAPLAAGQPKDTGIRDRFAGVWKLISYESKDNHTGAVSHPLGTKPFGRLTYDRAGRMSAQLMNPGRPLIGGSSETSSAALVRDASCEQMREVIAGFSSYCGTFDVDESSRMVIHHVQASLIPSWVGNDQRRHYEFGGENRLTLTVTREQTVGRLVWQREE